MSRNGQYAIPACVMEAIKAEGYEPPASMAAHIEEWASWYDGTAEWYEDRYVTADNRSRKRRHLSVRPARRVCRELSNLIVSDDVEISAPESEAGDAWVRSFAESTGFLDLAGETVEDMAALGTAAWALWFESRDGRTRIVPRSYDARMTVPLSWDVDGVSECAFATRAFFRGKPIDQLQMHVLDQETGTYHVRTALFSDGERLSDERAAAMGVVPDFDTGSEIPTFAVIRPYGKNTREDMSPYGQSLFADAVDAVKAVDLSFDAVFSEVDLTEVKVFMSDELIDVRDERGRLVPVAEGPRNRFIRKLMGQSMRDLYEVFSPEIRTGPLRDALNVALAELGDCCGFGQHYFVLDKQGGPTTATEVVSDSSDLMRTVRRNERIIGGAISSLFEAAAACEAALNGGLGPIGRVSVRFDDSVITDTQSEREHALAEMAAMPDVRELKVRYLVRFCGMSEDEAEAAVPASAVAEIGF